MSEEFSSAFATRLRSLREERGWPQSEVERKTGFTIGQISAWERAKSAPDLEEVSTLASVFEVSAHWLLTGRGARSLEAIISIANEAGYCSADTMIAAAAKRALREKSFWDITGPLIRNADDPKLSEADRMRVRGMARKLALEWGVDLDAGPPSPATLRFVEDIERSQTKTVRVVGTTEQRDGYTERRVTTYERPAPKPDAADAKKRKRGA